MPPRPATASANQNNAVPAASAAAKTSVDAQTAPPAQDEDTASAATPTQDTGSAAAEQSQLVSVPGSAPSGFNRERLADWSISNEMAIAVSEATVLGDLDKRLRDRIYKRVSRMAEKCELPQHLAVEWAAAKADRKGAKQLSFMKLWLQNNGTFGGATVSETASAGKDTLNRLVMGWKTKAQIRADYAGLDNADEIVEREIKGAKSIPHPMDKKDKDRRLYHVVVRVEEETVGVKSKRQGIRVSAAADVEAVGFVESVHDKIERENCVITRGPPASAEKKRPRPLGRHDSAASAASEPAPKEKKARVYTPGTAATRMRNLISRSTGKINDLCRQGTALAEQGTAVEDYIQRMKVCKEMNDRLLREKCNKESLPTDHEALASAINDVATELRTHNGVMNLFKAHLKLENP